MKHLFLVFTIFIVFGSISRGQNIQNIDLSKLTLESTKEILIDANKEYIVFLKNYIEGEKYMYKFNRSFYLYDEIDISGAFQNKVEGDECNTEYENFDGDASEIDNEIDLGKKIDEYIEILTKKGCDKTKIDSVINYRIKEILSFKLEKGEKYIVEISRGDKKWTVIYRTKSPGKWSFQYGFSYNTNLLSKDEKFFTKQNDSGQYVITKFRDNPKGTFAFIPSIMFQWHPNKQQALIPTFQTGLGFDLDNPSLFAGLAFVYRQNVSVSFGFSLSKKSILLQRYSVGEEISTDLEFSQLHNEVYRPDIYLSISFRFGSNPFKINTSNSSKE